MSAVTCQKVTNGIQIISLVTSVAGRLGEPVRSVQDQVRAQPDDRVGRVLQVQHPGPVPGLTVGRNPGRRVVREPDRSTVPEDRLHLRGARVPAVGELPVQRVERRRPGQQDAVGAVGHVGLSAERCLRRVRAQAQPERVQLGSLPDRPVGHRPKLYAFGLSLGSYAAEAPFSGEADMANRTDGILLAGPPAFNPLNREFTDGRDPGTPEVQPVFRDGRTVRFTNDPADGIPPDGQPWDGTRVLYLQHASDPVVWLSPDLILHRPDWLAEPPGPDVTSEMIWIPFVTFWQVAADLLEPVDTPPGHGHTYTLEFVDGWAALLQPAGWTTQQADTLRGIVAPLN